MFLGIGMMIMDTEGMVEEEEKIGNDTIPSGMRSNDL